MRTMHNLTKLTVIFALVLAIAACSSNSQISLNQSSQYYNYIQPTFTDYLQTTEEFLVKNREFISSDREKELAMNMPFELRPEQETERAILLVHGLGDSPYSFSDIGKTLQEQGFYVQTVLLPGHGSKPADLMLPNYSDWQLLVDHYANMLKTEYDEVWLGGFSTGGNLVTIHSIEQGDIDGLILFSPGFQSRTPFIEKLAPLASLFFDGFNTEEDNLARYSSAPINGAIAYTSSANKVRDLLSNNKVTIPTFIAVSEADSIIDPGAVKALYKENFTHPDNQLLWYGEASEEAGSVTSLTMKLDSFQISTASHMSPLFAPENPYYGRNGEHRMCMNSLDEDATEYCEQGGDVWLSAWGYEEKGKVHARLTWNPYYEELAQSVYRITSSL
ncbi:putative Esterase/lipase [Vibrio nigripulchritudo SFn118]|nr:putative Esterase/lipase [Vibrio nigripulchritudo SFn118]